MKKRLLFLLMAAVMTLSTACAGDNGEAPSTTGNGDAAQTTAAQAQSTEAGAIEGSSTSAADKRYVYNTLSEDEKSIYDQILAGVFNYENTVVLDKEYDTAIVEATYKNVYYQEPEIFWFMASGSNFESCGEKTDTVNLAYRYDKEQTAALQKSIDEGIAKIEATFPENATDADKVIAIHDYLALNAEFTKEHQNAKDVSGPLVAGYSQCEGYAKAFAYACNKFGIENVRITGNKYTGASHAWNKVKIDGEWYNVDVTWDDPEGTSGIYVRHNYLFIDDAAINGITHIVECDFTPPAATSTALTYFKHTGTYATSADEAFSIMQKVMIDCAQQELVACQVACDSDETYAAAYDYIINQGKYNDLKNTTNNTSGCSQIVSMSMSCDEEANIIHLNLTYAE